MCKDKIKAGHDKMHPLGVYTECLFLPGTQVMQGKLRSGENFARD